MNLTVEKFSGDSTTLPLYQTQLANVELDCHHRALTTCLGVRPRTGRHGRLLWFPCRNTLTIPELNTLLDKIKPLARRVCNGYSETWNADLDLLSGELDDDATAATAQIKLLCDKTFTTDVIVRYTVEKGGE